MNTPSENLRKLYTIIKEADGYITITPEYNHSVSAAIKNTLDNFLEEYLFKPSELFHTLMDPFEKYSNNHLRQILAEMEAPEISHHLTTSNVQEVFGDDGELFDKNYERSANRFLDEFE